MSSGSRFSYQVVEIKPGFFGVKSQQIQDELNRLGMQGWELVAAVPGMPLRLFMKKEL